MLIGVLMIAAVALLVSAFLTGNTVLAGAALVVSLGAAVLYGISLRRAPAGGTEDAAAEDEASEVKAPAAAKADGKKEPTKAPAAKAPAEAKPAAKPARTTAAATTAAGTAPAEVEPAATEPAATTSAATKPAETAPARTEPAESKPAESKPAETRPAGTKVAATSSVASTSNGGGPALAGTTVVHVVPGRMRYHVDGCQVIDGQEVEDLTVDDARDEGFTACSRCAARGRSHATA